MQALSTAPVDMTASQPPAAASSPQTGQDGLFAARLKTAAENRAATAKKSETPQQQSTDAAPAAADHQPELAEDHDHAGDAESAKVADDQAALAAGMNGAAMMPPPAGQDGAANAATVATGENSVAAPARSNESAVALMLGALTAAGTAATAQPDATPTGKTPGGQENIVPQSAASTATTPAPTATPAEPAPSGDTAIAATTLSAPPTPLPSVDDHPLAQKFATTADLIAAQSSGQAVATATDLTAAQSSDQPADTTTNPTVIQSPGQLIATTPDSTAIQSSGQAAASATDLIAAKSAEQTAAVASTNPVSGLAPETEPPQTGPQLVQNQYGQILAIHQAGEPEGDESIASSPGKTGASGAEGKSLDINNNYIHSHLPDGTSKNAADKGDNQQADNSSQNQQTELSKNANVGGGETQATPEQLTASKGQVISTPENQGLIFSHQRSGSPLALSVAETDSSLYRLPTGNTVPEGTVVDQMISHFSVNKQLETGTVNLRLYPQELGELRMEIKVEQDNVKAHIIAQNPQAQEMIDRHLPRLREALEQQGLHLQHVEVTVAANDNASGERFQKNSGWQQPHHSSKNNQAVFSLNQEEDADEAIQALSNLSVLA